MARVLFARVGWMKRYLVLRPKTQNRSAEESTTRTTSAALRRTFGSPGARRAQAGLKPARGPEGCPSRSS
jgi:hypothetical protein